MTLSVRFTLTAALVTMSALAADNLFTGTWKLNLEKSKFPPEMALKSRTITVAPDTTTVEDVNAAGESIRWSYMTPFPGQTNITTKVIGRGENATVNTKQIDDRTIEHTWKTGDQISSGKGVLSPDGRTMTYTLTGTTPDGKPYTSTGVYERQ